MIGCYKRYCEHQNERTAREFLLSARSYDFSGYYDDIQEMKLVWDYYCNSSVTGYQMRTSGTSTGRTREYQLAPQHNFWFTQLETCIRYPIGCNIDVPDLKVIGFYPMLFNDRIWEYIPQVNILAVSSVDEELIDWFECFLKPNQSITLRPDMVFMLSKKDRFWDCCVNLDCRVVVSDWEPFFDVRQAVYVNDCMINWMRGVNFYTCPYGKKHFLPIFAKVDSHHVGLFNLGYRPSDDPDDYFEVKGEPVSCECGFYRLDFDFMPRPHNMIQHAGRYYYNPNLAKELDSDYKAMQFVQREDNLDVLYHGDMSLSDRIVIQQYFEPFDIRFYHNASLQRQNQKLHTFINNTTRKKAYLHGRFLI